MSGLTSRGRQRVESEEAAHACPQGPHRLLSLTKARQPQRDQNTGLPNGKYGESSISGFPFAEDKTQRAPGPL